MASFFVYFPCVYERIVVPLQLKKRLDFVYTYILIFENSPLPVTGLGVFIFEKFDFLLNRFFIVIVSKHWLVKVGVFFGCMRKFLYLCTATKVEKAFFMVF